jgi:aspartate/methionine/tyrosine aminotransferase
MLDESIAKAKADGVRVKAIVVINPGNPTGAVLEKESVKEVVDFARANDLIIMADEVYQENTYGYEFVSFAKALGNSGVPLFSYHSTSKGFYGECGHRGGYVEVRNPPKVQGTDSNLAEVLLKQASVRLCSNTVGQVVTHLMVSPPEKGSQPYEQFTKEKETILKDLYDKAAMIAKAFERMEGVKCFGRIGAMYLFPRLEKLPAGSTDFDYCMGLLEATGICTVNGAGFGQKEGTSHLRIAFLPPKDVLEKVLPQWIEFHNNYVNKS